MSTPYNPQQNGIAERKNRRIMEATKAMLHDQDLPMHLWEEATWTKVYVQNKTPQCVLKNKNPEETFLGEKPKINHLLIFGCPMYIYIPKEKRKKLDPSGNKGIFVGYVNTSKYHRIYFLGFKNIETRWGVDFDEDSAYK